MLFKGLLCLSYTALLIGPSNAAVYRRDGLVQRKYEHQLKDAPAIRLLKVRQQQPGGNQTSTSQLQTSGPVVESSSSSSSSTSAVILPTTDDSLTTATLTTTTNPQTSNSISSSIPSSIPSSTSISISTTSLASSESSESSSVLPSSATRQSTSEQSPQPPSTTSSSIFQSSPEPLPSTSAASDTQLTSSSTSDGQQPPSSGVPQSSSSIAVTSQSIFSTVQSSTSDVIKEPATSTSQFAESSSTATRNSEEAVSTPLSSSDVRPQPTESSTQSTPEISSNAPESTSVSQESSHSLSFFVPISTFRIDISTSAVVSSLPTLSVSQIPTSIEEISFSLFEPSVSTPSPSIPTSEGIPGTTSDGFISIPVLSTASFLSSINLIPTGADSILSDILNIPSPTTTLPSTSRLSSIDLAPTGIESVLSDLLNIISTSSVPTISFQTGISISTGSTSVSGIPVSESLKTQSSGFVSPTSTFDLGATTTGISFSGQSGTGSPSVPSTSLPVAIPSSGSQVNQTVGVPTSGISRSQGATFTDSPLNPPANSTGISAQVPTDRPSGATNTLDTTNSKLGPIPTDASNANTTGLNPTEAGNLQTTSPTNLNGVDTTNTQSGTGAAETDAANTPSTTFATNFGASRTTHEPSSTATETEEPKPAPPLTKSQTAGIAVGSATCLLVAVVAALYFARRQYQKNQRRHSTGGVYPEVAYLYDPPVGGNGAAGPGGAEAGGPNAMMSGGAAGSRSLTPDSSPYGAVPQNSPDGSGNNSTVALSAVPIGVTKPSPRPSSYGGSIRDTRGDYQQLSIHPTAFNPADEYPPMSPYAWAMQQRQANPEQRHNGPAGDEHSHLLGAPSRTSTPEMAPAHLPPATPLSPLGAYFTWRESGAAPRSHTPPPSNGSTATRSYGRYSPSSSANSSPYSDQGSFTDASTVTPPPQVAKAVPINKGWGSFKRYSDDRALVPQPLNLSVKRKPLPHSPSPHVPMPKPSQVLLSGQGLPLTVSIPRKTVGSKNKLDRGMGLEVPRAMYGASGKPNNAEEFSDDPVVHKKRSAETLFADPQHIGKTI